MSIKNLKSALPLIAGALADRVGVQVVTGQAACTDGRVITLPPLDGEDRSTKVKALGFTSHEAAHVSDTDMGVWKRECTSPLKKHVMNVLEDIRIEAIQGKRFPGCGTYLAELVEILVQEGWLKAPEEDSHPATLMTGWMLCKLRHDVLKQKAIAPVLEATEAIFQKTIPQGMAVRLEAMMFDVTKCNSTQEIANLSTEIIRMIEEEKEAEEQRQKEQQEQEEQEQSQPEAQDQPEPQGQGDEQWQDDDQAQGGGEGGDQSQETQGQGQSGNGGKHDPEALEKLLGILGAGEDDGQEGVGEMVAKQLSAAADPNSNLRIFNSSKRPNMGADPEYDAKVKATVNVMKHKFRTMMESITRGSKRVTSEGNRISPSHLHNVRTGGNIFVKKTNGQNIDVAVNFLGDISGSMSKIIGLTSESLYAMATSVDSVMGAKVSVAVFPTMAGIDYLSFYNDRPAARAKNFSSLVVGGGTPLSDSLARTCVDLLRQPQKRKIQFVLTDGEPCYDNHTKTMPDGSKQVIATIDQTRQVIQAAEAAGIEVIGVGIGAVDLSHLFDKWCSIQSLEDLPGELFRLLQGSMLKKAA